MEISMKELATEKTMTVKEVASALNVETRTINRVIKKLETTLTPLLKSKQGIGTG
jgi:predicted transcriptional regulator